MNSVILQQYGLKFNIIIDKDNNREARVSGGSQSVYLDDYLMTGNYKEFYSEELLPEIENAIQGNNFDPDGGGDNTFLTIDYPQSFLKRINGIDPNDGEILIRELDLVWHHVDDIDINMNSTMQLVFEDAHYITYKHSGSVKQMDVFFNLINGL